MSKFLLAGGVLAIAVATVLLLHQPGATNAENTPLTADAVTLTKTTLVTFQG